MFLPFGQCRYLLCALCVAVAATEVPVAADEAPQETSLHQQIDAAVASTSLVPLERADDLTFLRRVTFDLAGRIPTVQEARAFLADKAPDKRTTAIDRLLDSEEYLQHWANSLEVMLMERRGTQHVKTEEFRAWLVESLRSNKPLNQLCGELVAADGTPEKHRAASAFFLERTAEPNLMAREVGRMFFGVDLQCAQCHDHPLIDDYHQADYYGLMAFVSRTTVFRPNNKKPALLAESAHGLSQFKSVFTDRVSLTQPRVPGEVEAAEPYFEPGEEYKHAPDKNVRAVPQRSRREALAEIIRNGNSKRFRRNIANRIWALMLGRGIVHPVDLHHSGNPPSNPALLNLISKQFAAKKFDLRWFVREIALSEAYQAGTPQHVTTSTHAFDGKRKSLAQEYETARATASSASDEVKAAIAKVDAVFAKAAPVRIAWEKSQKTARDLGTKRDRAAKTLAAKQAVAAKQTTLRDALQASRAALKSAAEHAKDGEIAKLAEQARKRIVKEEAGLKKLLPEIKKLTATRDAEQKKFDPAKAKAVADYARLRPLLDELRTTRGAVIAAREKLEQARTRAAALRQRIEIVDHVLQSKTRSVQIAKLTSQVPALTAEVARMRSLLKQRGAELSATKGALGQAQQQMASRESKRVSAESARAAVDQSRRLLTNTIAKLKSGLGDDDAKNTTDELAAIATQLETQQKNLASRVKSLQQDVTNSIELVSRAEQKVEAADTARTAQQAAIEEAARELADCKAQIESYHTDQQASREALRKAAVHGFAAPVLQPLTPEQFCWSMVYATGQFERQINAERAKLNTKSPLTPDELKDAAKVAKREAEARAAAFKSLASRVNRMIKLFAPQSGQPQDFFATVDQALYAANGGDIRSWASPASGNLTDRLMKMSDPKAFAAELYLAVFTRRPSAEEAKEITDYLAAAPDHRTATQEIVWALLTSAEFRFHE